MHLKWKINGNNKCICGNRMTANNKYELHHRVDLTITKYINTFEVNTKKKKKNKIKSTHFKDENSRRKIINNQQNSVCE